MNSTITKKYQTPKAGEEVYLGRSAIRCTLPARCSDNFSWHLVCTNHRTDFIGKNTQDIQAHVDYFSDDAMHTMVVYCSGHGWEAVES